MWRAISYLFALSLFILSLVGFGVYGGLLPQVQDTVTTWAGVAKSAASTIPGFFK